MRKPQWASKPGRIELKLLGMPVACWGYLKAWLAISEAGYNEDLVWAHQLLSTGKRLSAAGVMDETAWVICCSGFRAETVRKMWPRLTRAFCQWEPAQIVAWPDACRRTALRVYAHTGKVKAILDAAGVIHREGYRQLIADAADPVKLQRLPFIGRVTCWHLAKLLGADVVKPDVHLTRAAAAAGYDSPLELCRAIAEHHSEPLTVIDSVLWRYGEQQRARGWPSWEELFSEAEWPELLENDR